MAKTVGVSLNEEQNERVRAAARDLVKRHEGNVSAAARTARVSQTWFSLFLEGARGCSLNSASRVASACEMEVKDLIGVDPGIAVRWGEIDGFKKALRQARSVSGSQFPDRIWEMVAAATIVPVPTTVEPMYLIKVAELFHDMFGGAKSLTSGSDTVPPSGGGGRKSGKLRTAR